MGFYEIHGMPSGHAQCFFYFMTYLALFVVLKYAKKIHLINLSFIQIKIRSQMPGPPKIRSIRHYFFILAQFIAAILVSYSR